MVKYRVYYKHTAYNDVEVEAESEEDAFDAAWNEIHGDGIELTEAEEID